MSAGLAYQPATQPSSSRSLAKFVDKASKKQGFDDGMIVAASAVKTHNSVLESNTGWALDPAVWAARTIASAELAKQNDRIAEALQRAGEDVILPGGLTLISAVTNIVEEQKRYRAVRFLPAVAARDRRPLVNGLKLFMLEHPGGKYFRYAVITHGELVVALGDIRGAIQKLSRRISKWHSKICKKAKINVHYRGIEFTRATAQERDDEAKKRGQTSNLSERYGKDTVLYHVHANVLYEPTSYIDKLWPNFLSGSRSFFGSEWKDCGRVEKVEEIVKYCSKPADTLKASDDELVWLYRQMEKLKICQPLGGFKKWMAELKKRREKAVRVNDGHGKGKLMRVKKARRGGKDEDKENGNVVKEVEVGDGGVVRDDVHDAPDLESVSKQEKDRDKGPVENIVIGLTLPQWKCSPWAEPMILLQNYNAKKLSVEDDFYIEEWRREARAWWDAARAPKPEEALRIASVALEAAKKDAAKADDIREAVADYYKVHTCSSTVPAGAVELQQNEGIERVSSKEPEKQVPSRMVETANLLKMAADEVNKRGDWTTQGVSNVLNDIRRHHRCLPHGELPGVVDVQMQAWRQRRADEALDGLFAAA